MIPEDPTGDEALAEMRKCQFPITLERLARSVDMMRASMVIGIDRAAPGTEQTIHVLKNRYGQAGHYRITGTHSGRWVSTPAPPPPDRPRPQVVLTDNEIPQHIADLFR